MPGIETLAFDRHAIAARIARDLQEGWCVNLGVGIPTLIPAAITDDREIIFHSENGVLGMAPLSPGELRSPWLINASKELVALARGGAYMHHADSFALIRGGHLDLSVMGAFQVAENGDFANWRRPHECTAPAVGGAMDLAVGAKRVWLAMRHVTRDGKPRLKTLCDYPLTAQGVVSRIYTDLAVIEIRNGRMVLCECAPGLLPEQVQNATEADLVIPPVRLADQPPAQSTRTQTAFAAELIA